MGIAESVADWAVSLEPSSADLDLAERSLIDTMAVTLAARDEPIVSVTRALDAPARWATIGHVLDFDDVHMPSSSHVSVVCVMATLYNGGDARSYLAGAGAMARIGDALGWSHYSSGWDATCTAGALGAAVAASRSLDLSLGETARAIALAVPAAGGVQRSFGSDGKSLQVGFAVSAGVRAAALARAGAYADLGVVEQWMQLLGAETLTVDLSGDAVPGGLAIKLSPCCYGLQRPIFAMQPILGDIESPDEIEAVHVRTPEASVQPLIHHRPSSALEGKFSLEYAIAASVLDGLPGFASFSDGAVNRESARRIVRSVETALAPGGDSLLSGQFEVTIRLQGGRELTSTLDLPPGAPDRPPTKQEFAAKLADCGTDVPALLESVTWDNARKILESTFG